MIEKYHELIEKATLLHELSPEEIQLYLKTGEFKLQDYQKNTVIHFEGEPCTKLEIILDGDIVVERLDENGGLLTIAEFVNNDILGGTLLFSQNNEYPMTVTSRQPSVILEIEQTRLFGLFLQNPAFLRKYLEYVADNTANLGNKLRLYVRRTIRESLLSFIEHEKKRQNSSRIMLNMTKKALADKIGVQRTSLSRELAKMVKDGLITFDEESITLLVKQEHQ